MVTMRIAVASALAAGIARAVWLALDSLLGVSLPAQIVSVGLAVAIAGAFYAKAVLTMRVPEARQIESLVRGRLRPRDAT